MKLFTKEIERKLRANWERNRKRPEGGDGSDRPVVKLFTPDANCTWLLSEWDGDDLLFGLCDVGLGEPELGYVSFWELGGLRGKLGLPIERDMWWTATMSLAEYAAKARAEGGIR